MGQSRDRERGVKLTVRTATQSKSMRLTWNDGTLVQLYFTPKGEEKSQVAVQHTKLPAKEDAGRMKTFWTERLDALSELFAKPPRVRR